MMKTELRTPAAINACGISCWHPKFLQKFANFRMFMVVYGLLGTIQAMAYMYFLVTLTTIEKRFKIPSETLGIILSGNEISQVMLSLILSYVGGQRNRPRWIAWGSILCGLSCYILALPHFIYGAGAETLQLTKEYYNENGTTSSLLLVNVTSENSQSLCGATKPANKCEPYVTLLPLILIFLSQFVLGIGNTLYYSLGQTYLDDNTKKNNTPMLFAIAMSLRMIGPIIGFPLGYFSLNMFIDPTKTPLITSKDPRWLGAWWFGWMIIGTLLLVSSGMLGLFPKHLPKPQSTRKQNSHLPHALRHEELQPDEDLPLGKNFSSNVALNSVPPGNAVELPTLADFPKALMRLLRNRLLMYNAIAATFYILGAGGYMTFMTKYMEVQFHKTSQDSTIVAGPASITGMVVGTMASGIYISKYKPSPSKVLMWNVFVGFISVMGQISYLFFYCPDSISHSLQLNATCNADCSCSNVNYAPVCHTATDTTYFSACHAGCHNWQADTKRYFNCSCIANEYAADYAAERSRRDLDTERNVVQPGVCTAHCTIPFIAFFVSSSLVNLMGSSGRIGNLLVNYRAVAVADKSFAQGLLLMMLSLLALIPGPIIFGRLIDSTCLLWSETCNDKGNCQLYDQTALRYIMNGTAAIFTALGVGFDVLVWKNGKTLDLYGDNEAQRAEKLQKRNQPITPLLAKE